MPSSPHDVARVYDRVAGRYDGWSWQEFWRQNERPLLVAAISREPDVPLALDVGIGTGAYVSLNLEHAEHLVGIDISRGMLGILQRRNPDVSCVVASATSLPFRGEVFHRLVATRVLSHVPSLHTFFREAGRVLRPGSTLIISDVDPEHDYGEVEFSELADVNLPTTLIPSRHSVDDLIEEATPTGAFVLESAQRLRFSELRWKPPTGHLPALDRSDLRHIFYVAVFRRG